MPWVAAFFLSLILSSSIQFTTSTPAVRLGTQQSSRSDLVNGIDWRDEDGNVPLRREVHDLKDNHPDQWNLYILALNAMQMAEQQEDSSYYAVAGIHGRPYKTWKNATGLPYKVGTTGYCPHNNALFLSWHRPYLALFEKELYDYMQDIALRAPADQVDRYKTAADSFRMPYWDWARGEVGGGVPEFFVQPSITVTTPNDTEETLSNPLYAYDFRPLVPGDFTGKWAQANTTVRWPATEDPWEKSRNDQFKSNFQELQRALHDGVEMAFRKSRLNTFVQQIEEVHGWMHGTIGGGYSADKGGKGHMWPLEYSSFEPLFWLHHTNVDRLFALYQVQNPNKWLEPSNVGSNGNVFIEDDATVDAETPLLPFRRTPDSFWTTNEIRNTTTFGYAYPETISSDQSTAKAAVSLLYSGSTRARITTQVGSAKIDSVLEGNQTFTDWIINTSADPLALPPTFIVQFSLVGDFSSDPVKEVGMWSILMPMDHNKEKRAVRRTEGTTRPKTSSGKIMRGAVGITANLLDEISTGRLNSLHAEDVVPFLKDRLTWKIFSGNGTQLSRSNLDAIAVEVASTTAQIPSDPNDPIVYSDQVETYPEITLKGAGGDTA